MNAVLIFVLLVLVIGLLVKLHVVIWSRHHALHRFGHQVHFASTEDGWHLALHRYLPKKQKYEDIVVLCHGLATNRINFDIADDRSLARYLNERGFEVWSVELRGAGLSKSPAWILKDRSEYEFNHYLEQDLPAVLKKIRQMNETDRLFWVGHGLGGLLGYAWSGLRREPKLCGLVSLGSPVAVEQSSTLRRLWQLLRVVPVVFGAFRPLARFFSPMSGWSSFQLTKLFSVQNGLEGVLIRKWLVNAVENTSGTLLRQCLSWSSGRENGPRTGQQGSLDNLSNIQEPVLIVASDADRIAPPETVIPAYRRIASQDKQLRVYGNDCGDDFDFGHIDILFGIHAPQLIYPEVADWLESRASLV